MSAGQQYGKMLSTLPEFVQNPDCTEVVKVYRNSATGVWYQKNSLGVISLYRPGANYKSYVAKLTQAGIENPSAIVLGDNSIGAIVWTRLAEGSYLGTLAGAFPVGRTRIIPPTNSKNPVGAEMNWYAVGSADANTVFIKTGEITALGVSTAEDGVLTAASLASIEILVYPAA